MHHVFVRSTCNMRSTTTPSSITESTMISAKKRRKRKRKAKKTLPWIAKGTRKARQSNRQNSKCSTT